MSVWLRQPPQVLTRLFQGYAFRRVSRDGVTCILVELITTITTPPESGQEPL